MSIVKFVDEKNWFVSLDGANVSLYTVTGLAASAVITPKPAEDLGDGDYFFLSDPDDTFVIWFDKVGDSSGEPEVSGIDTDNYVRVDISGDTTATEVGASLQSALDTLPTFTSTVNSDGDIEVDADDVGECKAPTDYNTGLTFSYILKGYNPNQLVKAAAPDPTMTDVVEVLDAEFTSATDTLYVVVKAKRKYDIDIRKGYRKEFRLEARTYNNWIFG